MAIIETNSSLLKAEVKMNSEINEFKDFKEEAKYTTEVPEQYVEREI